MDLPYTGHSARQLTGRILAAADLVLVFEEHHFSWVMEERPEVLPHMLSLGQAAAGLAPLPAGTRVSWERLSDAVRGVRPDPLPEDWISDPYRRGADAAARAAQRISDDIDAILAHVHPAPPESF